MDRSNQSHNNQNACNGERFDLYNCNTRPSTEQCQFLSHQLANLSILNSNAVKPPTELFADQLNADQLAANQLTAERLAAVDRLAPNLLNAAPFAAAADLLDVNPFAKLSGRSTSNVMQLNELKRRTQKISDQINAMQRTFEDFSDRLNLMDDQAIQLMRQNDHCWDLLITFDEFLQSFEEQSDSAVDCTRWFIGVELMKEELDDFDDDTILVIQRLNDKMERLYDQFAEQKLDGPQTIANLDQLSDRLCLVSDQIANADLELDNVSDYFQVELQRQRDQIGQFVNLLAYIVGEVQNCLTDDQIGEFDCFTGRHFLQEFNATLNRIQII